MEELAILGVTPEQIGEIEWEARAEMTGQGIESIIFYLLPLITMFVLIGAIIVLLRELRKRNQPPAQ